MAKSILSGLSVLLGIGAIAFGVVGALSLPAAGEHSLATIADVSLRPLPPQVGSRPSPAPTPASNDAGAVEAPTSLDAGAPPPAPGPVPTPVPPDAGAAAPVVPVPVPTPRPDAGAAAPKPPAPPPQPVGEGLLTLRSSDTADVFVDGKKVGSSPVEGLKVRAGAHKVRFDCYDAAGNTTPGSPKSVTVPADGEQTLEFECPAPE